MIFLKKWWLIFAPSYVITAECEVGWDGNSIIILVC